MLDTYRRNVWNRVRAQEGWTLGKVKEPAMPRVQDWVCNRTVVKFYGCWATRGPQAWRASEKKVQGEKLSCVLVAWIGLCDQGWGRQGWEEVYKIRRPVFSSSSAPTQLQPKTECQIAV